MINFRTQQPPISYSFDINYNTSILGIGSCFVQNIGLYLKKSKFDITINPHGVVYNPISIANSLESILKNTKIQTENLVKNQGQWHSLDHHSQFSSHNSNKAIETINQSTQKAHQFIIDSKYLIITFGTAFTYSYKKTNKIVANCHKIPQKYFDKELLSIAYIVKRLSEIFKFAKAKLRELEIILTVSPIRHLKDGIIENQKSKATLLLAVHELVDQFDFIHYFPSYEIMMDDLRDYRFFQEDLVHPNDLATKYIWEYFKQSFFNNSTLELIDKIDAVIRGSEHRPFNPYSDAHQKFIKRQLERIQTLKQQQPNIDFSSEISVFEAILL